MGSPNLTWYAAILLTLTADPARVEGLVPAEGVALEPGNAAADTSGSTVPPTAAE